MNGFPNYWAWGFEDNLLNKRVLASNITIDRSQFYLVNNPNINQSTREIIKGLNRGEFDRYTMQVPEGINSIQNFKFNVSFLNCDNK